MKCSSCGAELQGTQACPFCGVLAQDSTSRPGSPIVTGILVFAGGAIVLCLVIISVGFLQLRAQFRSNPAYRESLAIARSSSDVRALLGGQIEEGWMTFVEMRRVYGSDFAEWTGAIKGPKGHGWLNGVANRTGSSWRFSRLVFLANDGKVVDLTPPPEQDGLLAGETRKKLILVPLGSVPDSYLAWAPTYYKAKFALNVEILPPISLDASAWNAKRRQFIAENLLSLMKQALPEKVQDQSAILIGVISADMYIQSYDWNYAINYREDGRFGVVSLARLHPVMFFQKWNSVLELSRLRKMLTKNVYLECFGVPLSSDPTSAVSGNVMSPLDVDPMSDEIVGAENRWHSQLNGVVPTISVVFTREQPAAWNMEWSAKPPTELSSEYFASDLWVGSLIQRKTDFYFAGETPLQFVRTYASSGLSPREFGMGTTDSLDISLSGIPAKYLVLTLENGVQTQFDRDTSHDREGKLAYRGRPDYFSPFSQGAILMHGLDSELETTDGWKYFFPYHAAARAEEKYSVLTGYANPQGKRYEMERKPSGDLLRITTPAGQWLNFERDGQNRFRSIKDSEGRVVNYDYDSRGDLIQVSNSGGDTETYRYNEKHQMTEVLDGQKRTRMSATYSPEGWITSQTLADGRAFQYEYRRGKTGDPVQIRFTDPRGYITVFDYVGKRYFQSLPSKFPNPKQGDAQPFLE
ncbi:MAG TPA: cytochrome c oxidase assembly factor Coa1 family protein [Candidatus Acidoferrum sp.]|nr:cytochrome c oxidase assembly factor Coa1 family protein [Candidatus Acidoferrum sp.]